MSSSMLVVVVEEEEEESSLDDVRFLKAALRPSPCLSPSSRSRWLPSCNTVSRPSGPTAARPVRGGRRRRAHRGTQRRTKTPRLARAMPSDAGAEACAAPEADRGRACRTALASGVAELGCGRPSTQLSVAGRSLSAVLSFRPPTASHSQDDRSHIRHALASLSPPVHALDGRLHAQPVDRGCADDAVAFHASRRSVSSCFSAFCCCPGLTDVQQATSRRCPLRPRA